MSKTHANRLVIGSRVAVNLTPAGALYTPCEIQPTSEYQLRPLVLLERPMTGTVSAATALLPGCAGKRTPGGSGWLICRLASILSNYYDGLEALNDPRQRTLMADPLLDFVTPAKRELLEAAVKRMEEEYGRTKSTPADVSERQPSPGGKTPSGPDAAVPGKQKYSLRQRPGEEGFTLSSGAPKPSRLISRLDELQAEYPKIDRERAAAVLRAFPEAENSHVAAMAADPKLFNQVAKGNLSATEQAQLFKKASDLGQQRSLPGLTPPGRLFKVGEAAGLTKSEAPYKLGQEGESNAKPESTPDKVAQFQDRSRGLSETRTRLQRELANFRIDAVRSMLGTQKAKSGKE